MEREVVESILDVIKTSTDKRVIYKGLVKLRTDLVKDKNGIVLFREVGGVPITSRFLQKPHEAILEVALSILGNCCIDNESCKQSLNNKITGPLSTIVKSIPNPVIQCRSLRLLGNLAKFDTDAVVTSMGSTSIATSIYDVIKNASNVQTRTMAVRACRFLTTCCKFVESFGRSNGFPLLLNILTSIMHNDESEKSSKEETETEQANVGLKKNLHREKYFEEVARNLEGVRSDIFDHEVLKHYERPWNKFAMPNEREAVELMSEILKCFITVSEASLESSALMVWKSIVSCGANLAPIVFLVTIKNKYRAIALKILSNISKNPGSFAVLSGADAVVATCELLTSDNEGVLVQSEVRHCINVIVLLSADACNRSKIRRTGALRKLIAILKDSDSQTERSMIWFLLNNFQYDNLSMELMFREGIVLLLIRELDIYLTSDDEYVKRKRLEKQQAAKKRKLPNQGNEESLPKLVKVREEVTVESPCSSPRSCISLSSPCSSRSMSPLETTLTQWNDDDETYSPVCSDDEEDTEAVESEAGSNRDEPATIDNSEIMKLLDIASRSDTLDDSMLDKDDDDDLGQEVPVIKIPKIGNLPRSTIDIIENLIFRTTSLIVKHPDLGRPETLDTLIRAIRLFGPTTNFAGSLTNILLESQFFAQVIKQGIAHQLYQLSHLEESRTDGFAFLETLTCVGESNYGKAELARLLRSDNTAFQKRAAITVAYIVRSHRLLYQFLNDGNALTVLLDTVLSAKPDEYADEAIAAITCLSRYTLGIGMTHSTDSSISDPYIEDDNDVPLDALEYNIRFLVHAKPRANETEGEVPDSSSTAPVIVKFNKELLCQSSEVFKTMLNSDFRESNEHEIHLRTCTVSGLKYFLNLIVLNSKELSLNMPPSSMYSILLEAFEMSRVYIIPALEEKLQLMLIDLMDETNCLSVLEWSLKNYHVELTETAINYFLGSLLDADVKISLFRSAEDSMYANDWMQMIIEAVLVRCRNGI